jgi:hypothetical protein
MTDGSVIDLRSRRPAEEADRIDEEMERKLEEIRREAKEDNRERMLLLLGAVREMVESGQIDSLAILGRNPENGIFLSELLIADGVPPDVVTGFVGALEIMKTEATDMAISGPRMLSDGTYFSLEAEMEIYGDGE